MQLSGDVSAKEASMIDNDLKEFKLTCEKPYDRHKYKLIFKNGKAIIFEDYELLRHQWYQWKDEVDRVEVIDEGGKGF